MPVIKIVDSGDPKQEPAAAVMALALSKGSQPARAAGKRPKRVKPEKTRPGNPNRLTVNQHVFPLRTMEQFTQNGRVSVYLISRRKALSVKPNDSLFCAHRAWDDRAEVGYMKRIEDEFQAIVAPIVKGRGGAVALEQKPAVGVRHG